MGGGSFTFTNKVLPGSYINFISTASAASSPGDRGTTALALSLPWGPEGEMMTVSSSDFYNGSKKLFGRACTHEDLMALREVFQYAKTCYVYRLESGGTKAACSLGEAMYPGSLGNEITITVTVLGDRFVVGTYLEQALVHTQTVAGAEDLADNDYVRFNQSATLTQTAGMPMTGGADGLMSDSGHQKFLAALESYPVNAVGCSSNKDTVKVLYADFVRRMREDAGIKTQCVLFRYSGADYEGVISVENTVGGDETDGSLVYWVTGVAAGCALNRSNTNRLYGGELAVDVDYTQAELESFIEKGVFVFHRVSDEIRVLEDVNTFISWTAEKSKDFSMNQTVRILDQIATDIGSVFASKYLGLVPNDSAGRISLWNEIVSHHRQLETAGAIEGFEAEHVTVSAGEEKRSVIVQDTVTPVCAMSQLYMTVVVQ